MFRVRQIIFKLNNSCKTFVEDWHGKTTIAVWLVYAVGMKRLNGEIYENENNLSNFRFTKIILESWFAILYTIHRRLDIGIYFVS